MECLKCGASVSDENAVYCGECGARLDGKKPCPSCGQFIEERYAYCIYCGVRADGKKACPNCGKFVDGGFCPDCGTALSAVKVAQASAVGVVKMPRAQGAVWNTVFSWIRSGAGIACTLFALIFVFLIGYGLKAGVSESVIASLGVSYESKKLFYYFGDVYKELKELKDSGIFQSELPMTAGYIYAILGTVLSSATIACVVGFAVPSIIGFVKFATTRVENNGAKWGVAAAIAYLCGVVAMGALDAINVAVNTGTAAILTTACDGATKAGITLAIIFLSIYVLGNFVRKGRAWKNGKNVAFFVMMATAMAFAVVVFALGKSASVGSKISSSDITVLSGGFAMFYQTVMLVAMTELTGGASFYNKNLSSINTSFAFSVAEQILLIAVIICAACLLVKYCFASESDSKKGGLVLSICLSVFTVAALICGCVAKGCYHEIMVVFSGEGTVECTLKMGAAIVAVVMSILQIAAACVKMGVGKKR